MVEIAARKLIAEHLGVSPKLVLDAVEFRNLGADSLDLISLTMKMEVAFDVRVSDEEVEKCTTIGEAIQLLRRSLPSRKFDVQEPGYFDHVGG